MSEDMSELFYNFNKMLQNDEIPDEVKNMMNQFSSSKSDNLNNCNNSNYSNSCNVENHISSKKDSNSVQNDNSSNNNFEFDMNTMLKMKSIIEALNSNQNNPRSNLLKSLKPYLKPSRKEKVDKYIQLMNMGKVFEAMNPLEGEKKNDV